MASSSFPYPPKRSMAGASSKTAKGISDYLQSHDKLGKLLPTMNRVATLQKACENALPVLFEHCTVMHCDAEQLTIAAPTAALASKLRQKLPNLKDFLQKQGWQVSVIRIKVQVGNVAKNTKPVKQITLTNQALGAFQSLEEALEPSSRNTGLKDALRALVQRHKSINK